MDEKFNKNIKYYVDSDFDSLIFIGHLMNFHFDELYKEDQARIMNRYINISNDRIMKESFLIDIKAYQDTPELNFNEKNKEIFTYNIKKLENLTGKKVVNIDDVIH